MIDSQNTPNPTTTASYEKTPEITIDLIKKQNRSN